MKITEFIKKHFKHFNAAALVDAAEAYKQHINSGNKMLVSMAGAMSTAELGISLAEMIRQDKVHAISCTGANLEEDIFNLIAHNHYKRVPHYRDLSPKEEEELLNQNFNRVTDTCIPEEEAMRIIENKILNFWQKADKAGERYLPHEYIYQLINSGELKNNYQIDPKNSWLLAACEKNIPLYVPGWEDSTLGNFFVSNVKKGNLKSYQTMKSGLEYMDHLISFYSEATTQNSYGFFQIGGGIAGDFPICVVPLINQDLKIDVKLWSYFCQISDSTTSYGSYSGAVPNEQITWGKLNVDCPKHIIESDASIVAPLIFAYVLGE